MKKWLELRRVRIFGARVYVHWTVLAVIFILALTSAQTPIYAAVSILSYLGVVVLHEAGHAVVAHRLGYEVSAIKIAFLHGSCHHEAPYSEFEHVLIAWGGVLAQLAVAIPILIVATLWPHYDFGYAAPAVAFLGYVNVLVALVNLAPTPGMDGRIAWRVIPLMRQRWRARRSTKRALGNLARKRR